jgi:hypothetical protein
MHLVSPLAAGINGANNGTARLYRRGTSTPASYYLYFEATSLVTTGAAIPLDENGAVVVYVNEFVNVLVYDAGGLLIREFVAGSQATGTELISSGFTGTSYDGQTTEAGQPTNLKSVLDKWLVSAGAADFNVLFEGSATTLEAAVSALAGVFYNVKSPAFGALGDGATDDFAAIQAAITAASNATGGIVFFPVGDYRISQALQLPSQVNLLGVSANTAFGARLVLTSATQDLLKFVGTEVEQRQYIRGLTFTRSTGGDGSLVDTRSGGYGVLFEDCLFYNQGSGLFLFVGRAGGSVRFKHCNIKSTLTGGGLVSAFSDSDNLLGFEDCLFDLVDNDGNRPISADRLELKNCEFKLVGAAGNGVLGLILARLSLDARGCRFPTLAGATDLALFSANSDTESVYEDGTQHPCDLATNGSYLFAVLGSFNGRLHLGGRIGRVIQYDHGADTTDLVLDLANYDTVIVNIDGNQNFAVTTAHFPFNQLARVVLRNTGGVGSGNITPDAADFILSPSTVAAGANAFSSWQMQAISPSDGDAEDAAWYQVGEDIASAGE